MGQNKLKKANKTKKARHQDMRKEYDFSKGVRGKYAKRFAAGTNLVAISPELVELFPDSESVNQALRALYEIAQRRPLVRTLASK